MWTLNLSKLNTVFQFRCRWKYYSQVVGYNHYGQFQPHKLDIFFGTTEEKSEKELLKEILQEIKMLNYTINGSTETGGEDQHTSPASPTSEEKPNRGTGSHEAVTDEGRVDNSLTTGEGDDQEKSGGGTESGGTNTEQVQVKMEVNTEPEGTIITCFNITQSHVEFLPSGYSCCC